MQFTVAKVTLQSISPYSQSKLHDAPQLEKELKDAYEKRTWKSKAHVNELGNMVIPSTALHQALTEAAKYSKRQIPGQGKATWTAKFKSGIMLMQDIDTGVNLDDNAFVDIWCDSQGKTGAAAASRVLRRFPQIPSWKSTFEVWIVDPIITEEILTEMIQIAGLFIGIGRWRPMMNGGQNGRFQLENMEWHENRSFAA